MFAGKKSAQIREILISESAWEEMTCLFAPSIDKSVQVCIPPELADTFALQDNIRSALAEKDGGVDFASKPDIKFNFEQSSQTLKVTIGFVE